MKIAWRLPKAQSKYVTEIETLYIYIESTYCLIAQNCLHCRLNFTFQWNRWSIHVIVFHQVDYYTSVRDLTHIETSAPSLVHCPDYHSSDAKPSDFAVPKSEKDMSNELETLSCSDPSASQEHFSLLAFHDKAPVSKREEVYDHSVPDLRRIPARIPTSESALVVTTYFGPATVRESFIG